MVVCVPEICGQSVSSLGQHSTDFISASKCQVITQSHPSVVLDEFRSMVLILCHTFSSMHSHDRFCNKRSGISDVVKCESDQNYNNEKREGNGEGYEVSRTGGATGRGVRQIEQRILELRLRWALRRIQQRMVYSFQRRCEMRLFVILRLQYLYRRRRSRVRAAVTIQRFLRPILHKQLVRHRH